MKIVVLSKRRKMMNRAASRRIFEAAMTVLEWRWRLKMIGCTWPASTTLQRGNDVQLVPGNHQCEG